MAWMLGLHMSALNSLANETARVPILLSFSRAKPYSLEHPASFVQNDCFFVGACDLLEQVWRTPQLTMSLNWKSISNLTWSCELLVPRNRKPHWIHLANRCEFGRYPAWRWGTGKQAPQASQAPKHCPSPSSTRRMLYPWSMAADRPEQLACRCWWMKPQRPEQHCIKSCHLCIPIPSISTIRMDSNSNIATFATNSMEFRLWESTLRLRSHLRSGRHSQNYSLPVRCVQSEDGRNPNRFG